MRKFWFSGLLAVALAFGSVSLSYAQDTADKAEDVGGAAVDKTKEGVSEVGDKAEDAGGQAAKGAKVAGRHAKAVGAEAADKAEDAGDATVKTAKKSGNWLKRAFRKIF